MPDTRSAGFPLPIEAEGADGVHALIERINAERPLLSRQLLEHGAILLRGWKIGMLGAFEQVVSALTSGRELFDYAGGASPRTALGGRGSGVYTSTEYPPGMALSLHNELSYADVYPRLLFFFCPTAPEEGGETTIGDSRRITRMLDRDVVETFRRRQVRYSRNLSPIQGSGYSWQEAFATELRQEAERKCRRIGADFEWLPDGTLRMSQVRPGTVLHPETGEEIWFNQADGFHPSALDAAAYEAQMAAFRSEDRFRLNVSYGDGAPIALETLAHIRAVLRDETVPHRWREGDVLVLDNLLAAHGRMPFKGPRKIALAMI